MSTIHGLDADVPIPVLVRRLVQDNPYVALGAATGAGFLLGGGLGKRLFGSALEAAGRVAGAVLLSYVFDQQKPGKAERADSEDEDLSARESRVRARPPF